MIYSSLNGQIINTELTEVSSLHSDKEHHHAQAKLMLDRGLAYGDGVFTTARIVNHRIELLNEHIERLWESSLAIGLATSTNSKFKDRLYRTLTHELTQESTKHALAVVKVMLTAGCSGRGYSRLSANKRNELLFNTDQINIIVQIHPYPEHYLKWQTTGISVGTAAFQLGINPALAGIKHLNRLEQVLLRKELDARSEQDLIVFNCAGDLVEASASNVFIFNNNLNLLTPKLTVSGVNGLMRQQVIKHHGGVNEVDLDIKSLDDVSAMFICNTVMGVVPVHTLSGKPLDTSLINTIHSLHSIFAPISKSALT